VSAIVESFVIKQKFALRLHDEIHCNHSCIHDGIPGLEQKEIVARGYSSSSEEELAAALPRAAGV
jgi:hypothetical protein